jgi:hypothetical protein
VLSEIDGAEHGAGRVKDFEALAELEALAEARRR